MKSILILLLIGSLIACSSKKKTLSGEEPLTLKEFVGLFPDLNLPVRIADTSLPGLRLEQYRISCQ